MFRAAGARKYIVCNADEGDSGTFADRMAMEGDPFQLLEGMAIAAAAVGADQGYIYVRSEYPDAIGKLNAALELCAHIIAPFRCEVRVGAGAYVCGEETSLLNSLEGRRGEVRAKPPLPALEGLFGKPTLVNNVLTLMAAPHIIAEGGAAHYQGHGMGRSKGTMPIQLAGNVRHGGLYEVGFGITLRELVYDIGGGTYSGRRSRRCRSAGRSAPTSTPTGSTCASITRNTPPPTRSSAMAGSPCSTMPPTCSKWPASPWSSERRKAAASARRAASARSAGSR